MGLIDDNEDERLALLRQIASNTGGLDAGTDVDINGQTPTSRVGTIDAGSYRVVESDDLDGVDQGGSVTIQPGDEKTVVAFESNAPFAVLAVGATDAQDTSYVLERDSTSVIGGRTNSPLGLLNTPFSFVDNLGGSVVCERRVEYKARVSADADSAATIAGRLHVEVI